MQIPAISLNTHRKNSPRKRGKRPLTTHPVVRTWTTGTAEKAAFRERRLSLNVPADRAYRLTNAVPLVTKDRVNQPILRTRSLGTHA